MESLEDFYTASRRLVSCFNDFINKHALQGKCQADHICYKCASGQSFEKWRSLLEAHSRYMYQSIVAGRRIAYICLEQGIDSAAGVINFLELSDIKPGREPQEDFDHIEAYPLGWSYEEMIGELSKTESVIEDKRPHHTTHDIEIGAGYLFRCTEGPLLEKIKSSEMI